MQAHLQNQLQELAAAEAAAAYAFALRRERLAHESKVVAEKFQQLQSTGPRQPVVKPGGTHTEQASLPPHLTFNSASIGTTPASGQLHQGRAEPETPAPGPVWLFNLATGPSAPQTAAPNSGLPRLGEAFPE